MAVRGYQITVNSLTKKKWNAIKISYYNGGLYAAACVCIIATLAFPVEHAKRI